MIFFILSGAKVVADSHAVVVIQFFVQEGKEAALSDGDDSCVKGLVLHVLLVVGAKPFQSIYIILGIDAFLGQFLVQVFVRYDFGD